MRSDPLMGMGFSCGVMERFLHSTVSVRSATELYASKMVKIVHKTSVDLLAHREYVLLILIKTDKWPCKILLLFSGAIITVYPFLSMYLSQFIPVSVSPPPFPHASLFLSPCTLGVLFRMPPLTFLSDSMNGSDQSRMVTNAPSNPLPKFQMMYPFELHAWPFPSRGSQLTPWMASGRT